MILYQDEDIVVCEKPYGVSSQKSDKKNMIDILAELTGGCIYPVHRLDIQTTGLMVYAKNEKSASALSSQIAEHVFEKEYFCLCHGSLENEGEMTDLLYHDRIKNKSFVVKTKRKGAKEARLKYKVISKKQAGECELFLVHIKLFTGRTHQIRVQFASRGCPLYGDGKYGASDNAKIHLHSTRVAFFHPKTKKSMEFTSIPSWY